MARLLDADFVEILAVPPGKSGLEVLAAYGVRSDAPPACICDPAFYHSVMLSPGPVAFRLSKGKPRSFMFSRLRASGIACGIAAPLSNRARAIGILGAYCLRPRPFSKEQEQIVSSVANLMAAAVEAAGKVPAGDADGKLSPDLKTLAACPDLLEPAERRQQIVEQIRDRAVTEERRRIALEVHDSLAQAFTGIAIQLEAAQRIVENPSPQLRLRLQRAQALAREATAEARRIIWALKPSVLENTNLAGGLKLLASRIFAETPIRVHFRCRGKPTSLDLDTEIELLGIVQEAMHNVLKHSWATSVRIELYSSTRSFQISVTDNGCGFDLEAARAGPGFGLKGMQDRASRVGANLEIHTLRGKGTRVVAARPVGQPAHEKVHVSAHSAGR